MGYRGKVREREEARRLRAQGMTLLDIARHLGVAKSSVSVWVRDVAFTPRPRRNRNYGSRNRPPNKLQRRKQAEIARMNADGVIRIDTLSDHAFLAAGAALYAGEGSKRDGEVRFANTDASQVQFFLAWLRRFFVIDESKLRVRVYLHEGLDLEAAESFWSGVTGIPRSHFRAPYRAEADPTIRTTKHEMGCVYVGMASTRVHRAIMGLVRALLSSGAIPG